MSKQPTNVSVLPPAGTPRRGIYLLPNLLTSMGLLLGIYSCVQTMHGSYSRAAIAVIFAGVFDGLDGRVARMTNTTSRFGLEYDSLCDLVSFGVAPGLLIYAWALEPWGVWGWSAAGLYVMCAAIRLARFNVTTAQTDGSYFLGLPVPAAATMLVSVVMMYRYVGRSGLPPKHIALLLLTYVVALLMVSNIRYPSFKQPQLYKRQPMGAFVGAVVMLTVAVAAYQVFFFGGAAAYVISGPAIALATWWAARRDGDSDRDGENGDSTGALTTSEGTG